MWETRSSYFRSGLPLNFTHTGGGLVTQSCPSLCNPMGCSPSGSSVHGIFQARILEWVAIPFSRGTSRARELNLVLLHCRRILYQLSPQRPPCTPVMCRIHALPPVLPCMFTVMVFIQWHLPLQGEQSKRSNVLTSHSVSPSSCIHPKTLASNYRRPDNRNTRSKDTGAAFTERLQARGKTDQPTQHSSS